MYNCAKFNYYVIMKIKALYTSHQLTVVYVALCEMPLTLIIIIKFIQFFNYKGENETIKAKNLG